MEACPHCIAAFALAALATRPLLAHGARVIADKIRGTEPHTEPKPKPKPNTEQQIDER